MDASQKPYVENELNQQEWLNEIMKVDDIDYLYKLEYG